MSSEPPSTPPRAVLGAYSAAAVALGLGAWLVAVAGVDRWPLAIVLLAAAMGLEVLQRSFQSSAAISAADLPLAAGAMLLAPGLAVLTAAVAGALVSGRRPVARAGNLAAYALPTALAVGVLHGGLALTGIDDPV